VADAIDLDFYFDPACGWAWRTSIWIRRIAAERSINVTWKLFSLTLNNAPDDMKNDPSLDTADGVAMERTIALARRIGGNAAVDKLYVAYGNARHGSKENYAEPAVQKRCLEAAGLPSTLFDEAMADPSTAQEVRTETREAIDKLAAFGVPTLVLAGSDIGVFGPVIDPVPSGQEALSLWDSVYTSLKQPFLYEMKRTRQHRPGVQFADAVLEAAGRSA